MRLRPLSTTLQNRELEEQRFHLPCQPRALALKGRGGVLLLARTCVAMHVANSPRSKHDATPGETPRVSALGIGSGRRCVLGSWQCKPYAAVSAGPNAGAALHSPHILLKLCGGQVVSSVWPGLACVLVGLRALAVARVVDEHDETKRNRAWAAQSGAPGAGHGSGRGRTIAS